MTMVISIATMVKSKAPPKYISHFIQSGVVVGWGGAGDGGDNSCGGSDSGNPVVKAPTALQVSEMPALTFQ